MPIFKIIDYFEHKKDQPKQSVLSDLDNENKWLISNSNLA